MKTINTHGTYEQAIAKASPSIQQIANALRQQIIEIYPDVTEVPWPNQGIIGYGIGPKKMSEHFCYIGLYKNHVNLGFYYGTSLPDPAGLLTGTGKNLRHIKIRSTDDLANPAITTLLKAALSERQTTLKKK
jgi:hypothetical protein